MTLRTALLQGTRILDEARVPSPRLTAEVLLCHALGRDRLYLLTHGDEELSELAWIHYGRYLHERLQGKPTQYITKVQEFYGRVFQVSPAVLIPRPETEHVVEAVLQLAQPWHRILDVGAGSGAIAVTLALELNTCVYGTDISLEALRMAKKNAQRHQARVELLCCDLCSALKAEFDIVVSNPPYVPESDQAFLQREVRDFEPALALYGGPTGVEIYERLIPAAARILKPGGWFVAELGYQSLERVCALLASGPWTQIDHRHDLAGIPRVIQAQFSP
ncbi:MAG: peptide chain release factor N(5)-glutamine methyltransferase [Bryobacteraceae bacterium]|nr:peptide chain release factor N(5)-glutamine methyltransferase [Bryobacteraceae bacterium]MDW8380083.1 peptide chain release factor N(5)-glutamine methyltransferase [Bryobacterales bacterium]